MLHYDLTKIPEDFFRVHHGDLHSETFQKSVLLGLLSQNSVKGQRDTADLVKKLVELNADSGLDFIYQETDLSLTMKQVRSGELPPSSRTAL